MAQKNLIAWDVRAEDYPATGRLEEKLRFLLNYAILAPSGPNTQPWTFSIHDDQIILMVDFTRSLPDVEPSNRTMYMSLGCALANLLIAGEHFGMGYGVKYFPEGIDGEKIAEIGFREGEDMRRFPDLFEAITDRHTNRGVYDDRPIEEGKLQRLKEAVDGGIFRLDILTAPEDKARMAEILGQSHRIQLGNKAFRKDLARWIRPNSADSWDGLPGYAFGYSDFESYFGQFIFGTFDTSSSRARKEMSLMKSSPAVGVMSSEREDKLIWVKAGVEFEKLFLTATQLGVRFDLFSQPVAIQELRQEMSRILNTKYPQILIRMGYAPPARHTPRRLVEMVLVDEE